MLPFLCAVFVVGIIFLMAKLRRPNCSGQRCAHVVVLGDLGRSPRMCNHALQFEKHNFNVQLVGYTGQSLESVRLRKKREGDIALVMF
jgi:hypothetical protein